MKNKVIYKGKIQFDTPLITNKQIEQSEWKRTSMVMLGSDISEYYAWFIKKRYSLILTKPIRQAHITFISDKLSDFNVDDPDYHLSLLKDKYDGLELDIELDLNVKTNGLHWWLNVTEESREFLHKIRKEVGLERPYSGLHMTIGRADTQNLEHSQYILKSILKTGQ